MKCEAKLDTRAGGGGNLDYYCGAGVALISYCILLGPLKDRRESLSLYKLAKDGVCEDFFYFL